jgi:hypothetical protein
MSHNFFFLNDCSIPDEEDGDACIVLSAFEAEVLGQGVQLPVDHGVSIQKVEKIHDPENRLEAVSELSLGLRVSRALTYHHVQVDLAHKFDLHGIDLFAGTKAISFCQDALETIFRASSILLKNDIRFDVLCITVRSHFGRGEVWRTGRRLQVLGTMCATLLKEWAV